MKKLKMNLKWVIKIILEAAELMKQHCYYQLYGQFYAVQSQYTNAIPWFEKALATGKMPRIGQQEVRFQLAQTYFMIGNYENVIPLLEEFIAVGEKYKYPVSARVNLLMSYSHGRLDQYEPSYYHIQIANKKQINLRLIGLNMHSV